MSHVVVLRTPGQQSHAGAWAERSPMCSRNARARPTDIVHVGVKDEVECENCLGHLVHHPSIPGHRLLSTWGIVPAGCHDGHQEGPDGRCVRCATQTRSEVPDPEKLAEGLERRKEREARSRMAQERARERSLENAEQIEISIGNQWPLKTFFVGYRQRVLNPVDPNPYLTEETKGNAKTEAWQAGWDLAESDLGV